MFNRRLPWVIGGFVVIGILAYLAGIYSGTGSTKTNETPDPLKTQAAVFKTSTDPDKRVAAVEALKTLFTTTASPALQARIINLLVAASHGAHEPYIFDAVFDGAPFQHLNTGDEQEALASLAQLSYSTYPTAYAAQTVSRLHFDRLVKSIKSKGGTSDALTAEQEDLVRKIQYQYSLAERAIGRDLSEAETLTDATAILVAYYQWQGHLLGDMSLAVPAYARPALVSLSRGIETAEMYQAQYHTDDFEAILGTMLYGYIRIASTLPDGAPEKETMRRYADTLTEKLRTHPEHYPNFFIIFKTVRDMQNSDGSMHPHKEYMEDLIGRVTTLAKGSDAIKKFLAEQGIGTEILSNTAHGAGPHYSE